MGDAVAIRWGVSASDLGEVRRCSLYPFMAPSAELDAEMMANPDTVFAGAFAGDTPIGCIAVLPESKYDCGLRIRWFGVLESERYRGIGTRLVESSQEYAAQRGESLWADVRIKAIPIYERLGFEPLGDFFDLPEIGTHRVMKWASSGLRP